jgi:hypothetical protein
LLPVLDKLRRELEHEVDVLENEAMPLLELSSNQVDLGAISFRLFLSVLLGSINLRSRPDV